MPSPSSMPAASSTAHRPIASNLADAQGVHAYWHYLLFPCVFFPVVFVCFFWVELRPLWQMDAMFPMCFKWRARVEMWIQDKVQDFLNPAGEIKAAHFSEAFNGSEECIFPMRMTFVTFAFMFFWRVPSYSQWYMSDAGQAKLIRVSVTILLPPPPSFPLRCFR